MTSADTWTAPWKRSKAQPDTEGIETTLHLIEPDPVMPSPKARTVANAGWRRTRRR